MYKQIAKIQRSKTKREILKLFSRPMTPTHASKKLDIHITNASRSIRKLEEMHLVKCLNSDDPNFRYYKTTPKGLKMLKDIESIEKL